MIDRPLRILMVSSEMESYARTGGLGDVVEALSLRFARLGANVIAVTPLYGVTRVPENATRWSGTVPVRVGWGPDDVRHVGVVEVDAEPRRGRGSLRVCLLDDPQLFARNGIYADAHGAFADNALRFATMSRGALEIAARAWGAPSLDRTTESREGPDVIHAHDWHAALAVLYPRYTMGDAWKRVASVITVHNLAFQGVLDFSVLDQLAIPRESYRPDVLEHGGAVNLLQGAIALADRVTTVSPTYAREIMEPASGFGLDGFLRARAAKVRGVVNGIDAEKFDPSTDPNLALRYDERSWREGKLECKRALLAEFGLDVRDDVPLFSTVSRLSWQKGIDLFLDLVPQILERGARVAIVGQGEGPLEDALRAMATRFPGRVGVRIAFDGALARRVYAASDFFMVPSRYEPCGLTQMYAMRYGAIPIVTAVGGLRDTVEPILAKEKVGTGFVASQPTIDALRSAVEDAHALYANRDDYAAAVLRGMDRDSSWGPSASEYMKMYEEIAT